MKKLQHQTSCYAKTDSALPQTKEQTSNPHKTESPITGSSTQVKNLETKLFLLEERTKSITQFYQQKMNQLKLVINKQHQTKTQLTQQLSKLTRQNLRQHSIIATLKNGLADAENVGQYKQTRPSLNFAENSQQKISLKRSSNSKGKANALFSSHRFSQNSDKLLLKKTKSSHNIESYYYTGQAEVRGNPQKPGRVDLTKFRQ